MFTTSHGAPQLRLDTLGDEQYATREKNAGRCRFESIVLCETGVGAASEDVPSPKWMPKRGAATVYRAATRSESAADVINIVYQLRIDDKRALGW